MPDAPTHRSQHTGDEILDRMQAVVRDIVDALKLIPFLWRGKPVSVQFTTPGAQQIVRHGLGVPAACFPFRMNYDAGAAMAGPTFAEWVPQPTTIDPKQYIALVASAVCTVDLWFYPRASLPIVSGRGQSL